LNSRTRDDDDSPQKDKDIVTATSPDETSRTSPQRLRAGVVGFGWAGQQHMQAYSAHPDVDLLAISGLEPEMARKFGRELDIPHDSQFGDYRDLLRSAEIDVLSVCTPTALHAPTAIAALEAGIHVLTEKPMAETASTPRPWSQQRSPAIASSTSPSTIGVAPTSRH
jgi:hypothetical protein